MQQNDHRSSRTMEQLRLSQCDRFIRNAAAHLTWWEELGIGFYPVTAGDKPYDAAYWNKYVDMAQTDIGRKLMKARVDFCERHYPEHEDLVDIGIGCGAFMQARGIVTTYGYDVNPVARRWLEGCRRLWNVHNGIKVPAVSMWDVLEHIYDFEKIINAVSDMVFISIPIFEDAAHVVRSKHYRKDEHVWYFTERGLVSVFSELGFELVEINYEEEVIGREDIGSFAFRRIK